MFLIIFLFLSIVRADWNLTAFIESKAQSLVPKGLRFFKDVDPIIHQDDQFFDKNSGNPYSKAGRILEWKLDGLFKIETYLDYFVGLRVGAYPFHSTEVYRTIVRNVRG